MIELDSLYVVLMIEVLVGLSILIFIVCFIIRRKSSNEQKAAHDLIDSLDDSGYEKIKDLDDMITEYCELDEALKKQVLTNIHCNERALYQKIIQMFLNKDVALLKEMDLYIDKISEPYCKIIKQSSQNTSDYAKLQAAEQEIDKLTRESKGLADQLKIAVDTVDQISSEYTRVFADTQTELILENSSKKMCDLFQQAEQELRMTINESTDESQ